MNKKIIAGNWKMNKTYIEVEDFFAKLIPFLKKEKPGSVETIICPPALYLDKAKKQTNNTHIRIGAQNCSQHDFGAYTGEISPQMLDSINMDFCIIGHSERRKYYGETDEMINKKVKNVLKTDIKIILCIGETLEQRQQERVEEIIINQLEIGLKDIEISDNIYIAYEPVWAIGTGKTATPQQAQSVHEMIRKWLQKNYSKDIAENTPILYGGSIKPKNCQSLLSENDIDGGLIGGASLDIEKFKQLIKIAKKI